MRLFYVVIILAVITGCSNLLNNDHTSNTFTLKFINTGTYPIDSLFLKPVTDTVNWGASVLPVAHLDSLQFVVFRGLAKASMYAFKVQFDSAGSPAFLKNDWVPTGPDTITAYAALGPTSWQTGHNWGWASWAGEQNVTP
jgi:hypothetical protein